jgi:hypothetical protein
MEKSMNFKLCLVGHSSYINDLETVINKNFYNIDVYKIVFNTDLDMDFVISEIEKKQVLVDAILYTGIEPYILTSHKTGSNIASYVPIRNQDLVHCLFKSLLKFTFDIYSISIDSMDYKSIVEAYESLELDTDKLRINIVEVNTREHNFVHKAEQEHYRNYKNRLSSICITSITEIYNKLKEKGIPCALLAPSMDSYISEIKTLILRDKIKKTEKNEFAIVTIKVTQNSDFYIYNSSELQDVLDLNTISQYIALFCQKLQGIMYLTERNGYVVLCNSRKLELLTDDFKNIEMLTQIPKNTRFSVNIGIGYGDSLTSAKKHSLIACNRSCLYGNDNAFVMYNPRDVVGPIKSTQKLNYNEKMYSERLIEIADNSKLSINTVYKIDCIIKQTNKREFTAQELAIELGVTARTANRIVLKLEDAGYLTEVGKHIIESKGRPSRIVKILF